MKKLLAPLIFVLVLFGCANVPAPQTPKQALVVAEYTFQGAVRAAVQLATVGTITHDEIPTVQGYIDQAHSALQAARVAVANGDSNAGSLLTIAQNFTAQLITYLESKRGKSL